MSYRTQGYLKTLPKELTRELQRYTRCLMSYDIRIEPGSDRLYIADIKTNQWQMDLLFDLRTMKQRDVNDIIRSLHYGTQKRIPIGSEIIHTDYLSLYINPTTELFFDLQEDLVTIIIQSRQDEGYPIPVFYTRLSFPICENWVELLGYFRDLL